MGKIYSANDGNPLPKAGTKIISRDPSYATGRIGYVSFYTHEATPGDSKGRVVWNQEPGQRHGTWISQWEIVDETPSVIDGLSDKKKRRLADEALAAAKSLGYCNAATKVLAALGLPVKEKKTFEVEVYPNDVVVLTVNGEEVDATPRETENW